MISLKQINNKVVKAIPIPDEDLRPIKGFDICEEVYANIFLCARKKSGKTSALFKILKECSTKNTILIIFCSTAYKDKNWIEIRKYFENKDMDMHVFTSIYEDGKDQLDSLVSALKADAKEDEEEEKQGGEKDNEIQYIDRCDDILDRLAQHHRYATGQGKREEEEPPEEKCPKKRKSKYQSPEYIIVFDDMSGELKSPSLLHLLKKNRHFKTKIIISSQWPHDLLPESRKQMDLFLIFKGLPREKLEIIYTDCDTSIPFETFYKIYKKATKKPFSFMYIDTRSDEFRCNFNHKFIINRSEDDNN